MLPVIMNGDEPNLSGDSTACQLSPKTPNSESVSKKFNVREQSVNLQIEVGRQTTKKPSTKNQR